MSSRCNLNIVKHFISLKVAKICQTITLVCYLAVQIQKSGLVLVLLAFLSTLFYYAHNIPWHVPKLLRVDAKSVNDPGLQNKVKGQTSAK